ncbi:MAG: glycosyltransferase family 2 protein [Lentisphaeria bacterium]|nr:glycosyltransferase family 2 protein [Lentisphaeria bacterium]
MRFSLILCTVNRDQVVRDFFESLSRQKNAPEFEVILVDQNQDDRLLPIVRDFEKLFPIRRIYSKPGLSRARNVGLQEVTGEIVAIPDDDCTYPPDLLNQISTFLDSEPDADGVTVKSLDAQTGTASCYMHDTLRRITKENVWHCGISYTIFVRREALGDIRFNEELGCGSGTIYGSGEETDFLLNLIAADKKLIFNPAYSVYHPIFRGPWKMQRGLLYGTGMGHVLRLHRYPFYRALYSAALQGVRAFLAVCSFRFSKMWFHLAMAYGRIRGYFWK